MQQGKERLAAGMNVLVYPEGTRVAPNDAPVKFNRSGAALAVAAKVPLVPICHDAGHCWPAHRLIKYPGTITVVFGPPLITQGGTPRHSPKRSPNGWKAFPAAWPAESTGLRSAMINGLFNPRDQSRHGRNL